MEITEELSKMQCVARCTHHGPSPIPQEGRFDSVKEIREISGFSHSVGTCAIQQGACKLTLNVKDGIIQEALVEVIGCSGMTQSAAMASEILPGNTLLEAVNTDLVCDAINVAMREMYLQLTYGRSQSAFTQGGLKVGAAMEDLGLDRRSQVGTSYSTLEKGPRYLELTEGYVTRLALDENRKVIGYEYVNLGAMMNAVADGVPAEQALRDATGTYGRYEEAESYLNPRRE